MKIYIWEYVKHLTDNWHHGGGCVVIAKNLEEARQKLPEKCEAQTTEPDFTKDIDAEEMVFIFPDAGCC